MNDHFINKFNLSDNSNLCITSNINDFGRVKINSVNINKFPWVGEYFNDNLITIEVITKPGYKFIGWSKNGSIFHSDKIYELELSKDLELNLIFEIDSANSNNIVINEINYKSTESFNSGDWIEITNAGITSQDLSGWAIKDENGSEQFIFPINTIIKPNDYLVIVEDSALFKNLFPNIENFIGNLGFKLNNEGELLQFLNNNDFVVDSVRFTNATPWPIFSNGTGSTIELNQPNLDNSIATNWHSSSILGGTPGTLNSEDNLTSDEKSISDIPLSFSLNQNYPNPFNPSTNIKYEIPNEGSSYVTAQRIKIMVYDVLGNLLVTLVDQLQNPGIFYTEFDGSKFSSGVYYYQLRSGNFVLTKKMLLIK